MFQSNSTKMNSENEENGTLEKAVRDEDIDAVLEFLSQGADPNHLTLSGQTFLKLAMQLNNIEIIKLLVQYGASIETDGDELAEYVFNSKNSHRSKELVVHIFQHTKDIEILEHFSFFLTFCRNHDGPPGLEIYRLLLDFGLPTDEFIGGLCTDDEDSYMAIHHAILDDRIDIVQELLDRGADIHKKTGLGFSCFSPALWCGADEAIIKLLVKKGVDINEKFDEGKTPLHRVCEIEHSAYPRNVYILCKYGADLNILDDYERTPLMGTSNLIFELQEMENAVIEELAKLRFENRFVCVENLEYIKESKTSQDFFDDCLKELQKMKKQKFYKNIVLYDIVKMSKNHKKKLIYWTKNKYFVAAFKSCWDRKFFKHYAKYLDDILEDTLEYRNNLQATEEQLYFIFKEYLPELVIRKLAYFKYEHLFFY